ncbi:MAG: twin-arginine translocation signal domain-containing protein [Rubripirellula sp.]
MGEVTPKCSIVSRGRARTSYPTVASRRILARVARSFSRLAFRKLKATMIKSTAAPAPSIVDSQATPTKRGMLADLSRRTFMRTGGIATAAMIVQPHVLGGPAHTPPSDRVNGAVGRMFVSC